VKIKRFQQWLTTVKVKDTNNLKKVKVGDQVAISYTEALAIAVEKAK
jgi:hypothetical protein